MRTGPTCRTGELDTYARELDTCAGTDDLGTELAPSPATNDVHPTAAPKVSATINVTT
jgi:hypothetical protein